MVQLRGALGKNRTTVVKEVADKATQNDHVEGKEDVKDEEDNEKEGEKWIDVKNATRVQPLRRSARAARGTIIKVDQVDIYLCICI